VLFWLLLDSCKVSTVSTVGVLVLLMVTFIKVLRPLIVSMSFVGDVTCDDTVVAYYLVGAHISLHSLFVVMCC
jgi:hypothetical protein